MEKLELDGKGLIIHHWDTDGVCSAAMLLNHLREYRLDNFTPQISNYFLTMDEIRRCKGYDFVIIADMALPEENISQISKNSHVVIFDHHLQNPLGFVQHFNPVAMGDKPDRWPSATWVVKDFFGGKVDVLTVLGIVGDNENKIRENNVFNQVISDFCRENNVSFEDLLKMVYLIDSNYKVRDKEEVERIPHVLKDNMARVEKIILGNRKWNENFLLLEDEIKKLLENKDLLSERDNVLFMEMKTPYVVISTVTRRLAWSTGKNVVVVNHGFFDNSDQVYVRSNNLSLNNLIKRVKSYGFNAGGKNNVMGAIVPKNKTDHLLEEVFDFFSAADGGEM
ncbi:single-stranded DNA-specific exonuclease [Euryarchaeota archaeon ex4484_162]|nr:MAG: DHH family phosphoesterase [Thermoplasmata archaeon]OYT57947.1 MAG: single-stranded DNA-specific exonuclease [Euryarchaeota archaeon ex4484_162]